MSSFGGPVERGGLGSDFRLNPRPVASAEKNIPASAKFRLGLSANLEAAGLFVTRITFAGGVPELNPVAKLQIKRCRSYTRCVI